MRVFDSSFSIKTKELLAIKLLLLFASQSFACMIFQLKQPPPGSVIAIVQPELHWDADQFSQSRVQISVVTPESRVLLSMDTVVQGNRFRFPQAIPSNFAAVKVLISQNCNKLDAQDLNAQGSAFFIDNLKSCAIETAVTDQKDSTLAWGKANDAQEYIVRIFEINADLDRHDTPAILATHTTAETRWKLPNLNSLIKPASTKGSAMIASVQPICDGRPGSVQSVLLSPVKLQN